MMQAIAKLGAGKYLACGFAFEACHVALPTISPHMILNFLAEKVLGVPKSY